MCSKFTTIVQKIPPKSSKKGFADSPRTKLPKNYQKIDLSSQFKLNGLVYILVDSLVNNFTTKKQLLNKYNSTLTSNKNINYTQSR